MKRPTRILVDLREWLRQIDPYREFPTAVLERYLASVYEKSHAIACLGDGDVRGRLTGSEDQYRQLLRRLRDEGVPPIHLPLHGRIGEVDLLSFRIRDDLLLIEDRYGTEEDRGCDGIGHGRDRQVRVR